MRLIDANAFIAKYCESCGGGCDLDDCCCVTVDDLMKAPTIDAEPVVHGRWVRLNAHKGRELFKCSVCLSGCYVPTCMSEPMYEYCAHCGAKMDGGDVDG